MTIRWPFRCWKYFSNNWIKSWKTENNSQQFRLQRYLKFPDAGPVELIARIEMPDFYPITRFDERLSSVARFDVVVYLSGGVERSWCKAVVSDQNGQKGIHLFGKPLELRHTDARKKITLGLVVHGECIIREEIMEAEALDDKTPWLFAKKDERFELYGMASQSLKNDHVLIYIPENFDINPLQKVRKNREFLHGSLYELNGSVICKSDDLQFKFSNQRQVSQNSFSLSGRMCSYALEPEDVFIGVPNLFRMDGQCRTYKLLARPYGNRTDFKKLAKGDNGYFETRVTDEEGNILFRRKIGILPEGFQLKPKVLNSTRGVHKGSLEIAGLLYNQLTVLDRRDGLQYEKVKNKENIVINFESRLAIPPHIHCAWQPIDQKKIVLGLPFPVRGCVLYDDKGEQVKDRDEFYMRELAGYRLVIYEPKPESNRSIAIDFELKESNCSAHKLSFYYNYKLNKHLKEIAVYHWKDEIEELLGISTSLDARVEISLRDSGKVTKIMQVARYQHELHADWISGEISLKDETRRLSAEEVHQIKISALSLCQPAKSIALLDSISTEEGAAAKWLFHYQKVIARPWLIYPADDSSLYFRPFLWNVKPNENDCSVPDQQDKTLAQAVSIDNEEQRLKSIKRMLQEMSADLGHESWLYLRDLWEHSDHIPLSTFDVWKLAVQQPKFLACLVVQESDLKIDVDELAKELPVVWELVPLNAWQQAVKMLSDKILTSSFGANPEYHVYVIKEAIKTIKSLGSSMDFIVSQLKSMFLKEPANFMQITKAQVEYLVQEKSQELIKSQQDEWPQQLHTQILTTLKSCADDVLKFEGVKERQAVFYLPIVLAYIAVHGIGHEFMNPRSLFYIRKIKAFNPQWFEFIYNLYVGWFYYQKES
ncbi:MAG: STY4851/ECs_5259 family protein [bacterium]